MLMLLLPTIDFLPGRFYLWRSGSVVRCAIHGCINAILMLPCSLKLTHKQSALMLSALRSREGLRLLLNLRLL